MLHTFPLSHSPVSPSFSLTHSLTVKIHFYPSLLGKLQKQKQNTIHNDIMYFRHPHCFNIYISIRSRYTYTKYTIEIPRKISYFHLHSFLYFFFIFFDLTSSPIIPTFYSHLGKSDAHRGRHTEQNITKKKEKV